MSPAERVNKILAEAVGSDLTSWERFDFLPSAAKRETLTSRQDGVLRGIEHKVFGGDDDE